jgi:hypothetical protein
MNCLCSCSEIRPRDPLHQLLAVHAVQHRRSPTHPPQHIKFGNDDQVAVYHEQLCEDASKQANPGALIQPAGVQRSADSLALSPGHISHTANSTSEDTLACRIHPDSLDGLQYCKPGATQTGKGCQCARVRTRSTHTFRAPSAVQRSPQWDAESNSIMPQSRGSDDRASPAPERSRTQHPHAFVQHRLFPSASSSYKLKGKQ